ncbi:MAG: dockerin type I domain-containing protein [Phycisphaerales bacterium]
MPGITPDEDRTLCDVLPYRGQHGPLSSGEYWVAVGNRLSGQPGLPWGVVSGIASTNPTRVLDFFFRIQPPDIPYCDGDFNWDGNVDQDDILYLANVLAGGENPTGRFADHNRDGNEDQDDLLALVHTIAGGGCP